jgi:nicotinate-nucleotide adenylyltransferase
VTAVGVLGGTFDPVHRGHLALARRARSALGLARVLLVPCADPPHKPERTLAERYHRLEMLYLAIEGWEGLEVCTYEIARGGRHYTIDTLRGLRREQPSLAPVFLIGSDALADLASWRDYESLLAEFDFAVAMRPESETDPLRYPWPEPVTRRLVSTHVPGDETMGRGGRVFPLAIPTIPVSSSLVRRQRAAGESLADLVPARVARYIHRHGLYAEETRR